MLRPSNVVYLYWARLRARWVQELLASAGIAVGVGLIFSALVANTSLTSAMRQLTEGIVGDATLQITARGPQGFDERLLTRVRRIESVEDAAPVLESRVNVVGPDGRRSVLLVGGDPRFAALGGPLLRPFAAEGAQARRLQRRRAIALPEPLVQDLGITLGVPVTVETEARTVEVPLAVSVQERDIGEVVNSPIALAGLAYAQRISGMDGRVTRIFVLARPGRTAEARAALQRAVGDGVAVRPADADVAVFEQAAYPTKQSTALFSGLSALVGFLFAFSAVLLTVPQRMGLIRDLQRAGHTMAAVVQTLLFDALVLGLTGSAGGLVLGDQLARHLFDDVPDYLSFTFSIGFDRTVSWQSVLMAGGAGLLAACIAVLVPVRHAFRTYIPGPSQARPYGDHPRSRAERLSAVAGLAALAATAVITIAAPDGAMAGLVALTIALLLLLPLLLRVASAAMTIVTRGWHTPVPTLAAIELNSKSTRASTLAVAATGALALFATVSITGARADLQRGLDASTRDAVGNADVWITFPDRPNVLATTPFRGSSTAAAAVERLDAVRAVRIHRGSLLDVGDRRAWVIAPPREAPHIVPPTQIREGDAGRAERRLARGGWTVLSEGIADELDVGLGDRVRLPSPAPQTFRVAAISTNLGWSPGAVVLNADDYATAWDTREASALHVDLAPNAAPGPARDQIERALPDGIVLRVETRRQRMDLHYAASRDGLARLTDIAVLVLVAAVLAMAIAMSAMIWQRRPAIAALKVHGFAESKLWRALLLESGVLLGTGCLIGAAFGLLGQILLSRALETITGFPVFYSVAVLSGAAILALVTAVALAILALPGWLAVRVRPAPGVPT